MTLWRHSEGNFGWHCRKNFATSKGSKHHNESTTVGTFCSKEVGDTVIEACDIAKHDCFLSGFRERSACNPELIKFASAGESCIVWKTCTLCRGQHASVKDSGRHEGECRGADSAGTNYEQCLFI